MTPEERVGEVEAELKRRNPGFKGGAAEFEFAPAAGNRGPRLTVCGRAVADISPVAALPELEALTLYRPRADQGGYEPGTETRVADLTPVRSLPALNTLEVSGSAVADLAPLRGLPLTRLTADHTAVADLTPGRDPGLSTCRSSTPGSRTCPRWPGRPSRCCWSTGSRRTPCR
jgi:hypothetical protein